MGEMTVQMRISLHDLSTNPAESKRQSVSMCDFCRSKQSLVSSARLRLLDRRNSVGAGDP